MTILQLKYVIEIANSNSMREAAGRLYISQPALSASVRELEEELGIKIFDRNNRGISLTADGMEFVTYAKQAVSQYEVIEERYKDTKKGREKFSVSMQHYVFAVHAFIRTMTVFSPDKYDFSVRETKTEEVFKDVNTLRSEIGIVSFSKSNESLINKIFRDYGLDFSPLMVRDTFAYMWKDHPLAGRKEISLEDLKDYPCISFDQSGKSDFYLPEEALGDYDFEKMIRSNDRATTAEIMAGLSGYSIGTGILTDSMALKDDFVCIKLKEEDPLTIGFIVRQGHILSKIGERYIRELMKFKEDI